MSPEKEYDSLRDEMLQLSNRQLNLVTFTLTASVTLIGFGIDNGDGFIALIPLILLAFLLNQQVITRRGILRISTYISYFLEPQAKRVGWETRVNHLRRKSAVTPIFRDFGSTQTAFALLPIFVGLVCIVVSFIYLISFGGYFWLVPTILLVLWTGYSISILRRLKLAGSDRLRREFLKAWAEIQSYENQDG
jgi:hypothetical protein